MSLRAGLRTLASLTLLYGLGVALGLALLVLAFRAGVLGGIDILFYRGLVIIAGVTMLLFAGLGLALRRFPSLGLRDAFAAAMLSLALNVSFLVVVPVTVDRSISIFILGQMAAHPGETYTPDAMSRLFTSVYVDRYNQIDRRLHEQDVSGNVEKVGDGYRITPHGRFVIETSKIVATLFDSHAGLAAPRDLASEAATRPRTAP